MASEHKPDSGAGQLDVYHDARLVGTLFDSDPLSFEYARDWLSTDGAFSLPGVPLAPGRTASEAVSALFENLLPEGALRDYISKQRHVSTTFSMLREVAGDTAGGLLILEHGQKPRPPAYEKVGWRKLAALLSGTRGGAAIDIGLKHARISLSGAQDKILIAIDDADGEPMLPLDESPSTHILKPDIWRLPKIHHSAINETLVMQAAAKSGLQTAEVFYEPTTGACAVRRFDRLQQHGRLVRLLQYDLCQLNGTLSDRKYESDGGPDIVRCAQLIREYSVQPAVDLERLLAWVFFNLCVGNHDGHAKNLSIHHSPGRGAVLTPFYDLMCTRVYPGLSGQVALSIGGENRPGNIRREHIVQMAGALGFRSDHLLDIAQRVATAVVPALEAALAELAPLLRPSGKTFAQRLQWKITRLAKQTSARILGKISAP